MAFHVFSGAYGQAGITIFLPPHEFPDLVSENHRPSIIFPFSHCTGSGERRFQLPLAAKQIKPPRQRAMA